MKRLFNVFCLLLMACGVLVLNAPAKAQGHQETEIAARLTGPAVQNVRPKGHAEFSTEMEHGVAVSEFEVEVEKVTLANATVLTVKVNDTAVGTITLRRGKGKLRLSTERGQTVPVIVVGSTVKVCTADGTLILSGTF